MAIEVSPRISFSHDLCPSPSFSNSTRRIEHAIDTISAEFDFSTSYEVSLDDDCSTPADLLFSQGKLLPLNNNNNNNNSFIPLSLPPPIPKQDQTLKQILSKTLTNYEKSPATSSTQTFWHDSRSSSVSVSSKTREDSVSPFPRSKSTGYSPNQKLYRSKSRTRDRKSSSSSSSKPWLSPSESTSNSANAKAYYYSGDRRLPCKNGVRINPVINVPAPFIPRGGSAGSSTSSSGGGSCTTAGGGAGSFFAYLLCNCRDKNMERDDNEEGLV